MNAVLDWVIKLPQAFAQFGQWLIEPLPYINIAPLALFSVAGITAIVALKAVRLAVGG